MAKKRYHDGMHEMRAQMREHEYYAGHEARRQQEMLDAGIISDDPRQVANMPQEVIMHPYEKAYDYLPEMINDTIRGIDEQREADDEGRRKNFKPKKY